ncbi:MAG: reverse transcriptase [Acidobacteria bacterium]|nr:reverse transcriptase [Acidobacteriota bacterium]
MIDRVASDEVIAAAFEWLCKRRKNYPAQADVWALRHDWDRQRARIQTELRASTYRLSSVQRITTHEGETLHVWRAADALVLKALAIALQDTLPISPRCTHVKGNGGAHGAIAAVREQLPQHRFVARTDVAAYYDSIDHELLLQRIERFVPDRAVLNLLGQYLRYTVEWGGLFTDNRTGICRGCSLSPLIGAFFLAELDQALERKDVDYVRFMDDIVILAPTRWKLRRAVKAMNEVLADLALEQHPDKTFIGRIERGFEFLGVHFSPAGSRIADSAIERFVQRAARLYKQEPDPVRLGQYCARWAASWPSTNPTRS